MSYNLLSVSRSEPSSFWWSHSELLHVLSFEVFQGAHSQWTLSCFEQSSPEWKGSTLSVGGKYQKVLLFWEWQHIHLVTALHWIPVTATAPPVSQRNTLEGYYVLELYPLVSWKPQCGFGCGLKRSVLGKLLGFILKLYFRGCQSKQLQW